MLNRFLDKYKAIPIPARASFWFLICSVLQNGLNIITLPIFTRLLTTEQYGMSSTYFAWSEVVSIICTLRLSYGVFDKGMIKYQNERDQFVSALMGLTVTISLGVIGLFFMFHSQIENMLGLSFMLCLSLFVCQMLSPALLFWTNRCKFEYRYQKFTAVTIFLAIFCMLFNLTSVLLCSGDKGIVKILSYQIVWGIANLVVCVIIFCKGKVFFRKDIWKYALAFNVPLIPYFVSTIILDKVDRLMISDICGQSYVALYSVSYNLANLMILFTSAIGGTFTPWIYQKISNRKFGETKKVSLLIVLGFMMMSTLFMLFAPELIRLFAAEEYYQAVYVVPPIVASNFFILLYSIFSKMEFYFEKSKVVAAISVIAAGLNVLLNYFAIPKWGYISAAYTTLICYIISTIAHGVAAFVICKKENIPLIIFPWRGYILLTVVMLVITGFVNLLYPAPIVRLGLIIVLSAVFVIKRKTILGILSILKERK